MYDLQHLFACGLVLFWEIISFTFGEWTAVLGCCSSHIFTLCWNHQTDPLKGLHEFSRFLVWPIHMFWLNWIRIHLFIFRWWDSQLQCQTPWIFLNLAAWLPIQLFPINMMTWLASGLTRHGLDSRRKPSECIDSRTVWCLYGLHSNSNCSNLHTFGGESWWKSIQFKSSWRLGMRGVVKDHEREV